jgi:hypothetical protein
MRGRLAASLCAGPGREAAVVAGAQQLRCLVPAPAAGSIMLAHPAPGAGGLPRLHHPHAQRAPECKSRSAGGPPSRLRPRAGAAARHPSLGRCAQRQLGVGGGASAPALGLHPRRRARQQQPAAAKQKAAAAHAGRPVQPAGSRPWPAGSSGRGLGCAARCCHKHPQMTDDSTEYSRPQRSALGSTPQEGALLGGRPAAAPQRGRRVGVPNDAAAPAVGAPGTARPAAAQWVRSGASTREEADVLGLQPRGRTCALWGLPQAGAVP